MTNNARAEIRMVLRYQVPGIFYGYCTSMMIEWIHACCGLRRTGQVYFPDVYVYEYSYRNRLVDKPFDIVTKPKGRLQLLRQVQATTNSACHTVCHIDYLVGLRNVNGFRLLVSEWWCRLSRHTILVCACCCCFAGALL